MKVEINQDEWYPVYVLQTEWAPLDYEIPEELYVRYNTALAAWESVQAELEAIHDKGRNP
jgi:hypothetical protein